MLTVKGGFNFLRKVLVYNLQFVLKYIPRKKTKWAFGAYGGFKDNPKFLYYDVIERHPEIQATWIASNAKDMSLLKSQGLPVLHKASLKGMWYALTAKVYIVDHITSDINRYLEGGAFYVNLWHGCGIKRVRWQNKSLYVKKYHLKSEAEMRTSLSFKIKTYPFLFRKPDLCLAPSSIQLKEFFAPMMDIPEANCIVGVYPRSRLMIEGKEAALDFIRKHEPSETMEFVERLQSYRKTYIYMPTWRNDGRDFIEQAGIDWQRLNDAMKETNSLFILKLHPFTKLNFDGLSQYSNICFYPKDSDVYTVLPFIDCLITDYSSLYTDFLTMNKEVILFIFDYDEFVKGNYELAEYDNYYFGKRVYDFDQLLATMLSGEDCHVPQNQYDSLMNFFWDNNQHDIDIAEVIKKRIGLCK